jgi:hypothetical protein
MKEKFRRRWKDKNTVLKERRWEGVNWINLAQHKNHFWAVMNMAIKNRVPRNTGDVAKCRNIRFARRILIRHYFPQSLQEYRR